jgi:hypothetical protein
MELAMPTPVSRPPSSGAFPSSHAAYPPQKYICKYKKLAKFFEILFYKKMEIEFDKLTFGNSMFVKCEI